MRIPDFTALGTNNPSSVGPISPSDSGSQALAGAVRNVGQTVGQIGDEGYKRQANLALATADSETIKGLLDLKDKIQSTDDYNNWQKDFDAQAPQVTARVRGNLMGPETQGVYDTSSIDHISRMSGQIDGEATKRREDVQRGGLAQLLQDNREVYMRSNDPETRANLLASTNEALNAASAPAAGRGALIDPATAVSMKKSFVEGLAKDYVQSLPPDQAINVLGASVPGRLRGDETGPSVGGGVNPNNIGNVKASAGGFAQPASPTDGVILAANNLRSGYRGLTIAQIAQKWAPASDHNDPTAWAANVSKASGVPVNAVPNLNDPKQLAAIVSGIGVAEKKPSDLSAFSPQVVSDGVTAALAGKHTTFSAAVPQSGSVDIAPAKTGTPVDFLPLADRIQLYHGAVADARTQRVLAAQADTISNQQTQNDFLARMSAGKLTSADVINSDLKPFGQGSKNEFLSLLKTNSGTETTLGPGFWDVYKRVTAPPGTPDRIADQSQLYSLAGPGNPLSLSGVAELTKIISGKGTPNGDAEAEMQKQFFMNARHQISGSNEGLHLLDPKGDDLFLRFQAHAFADIAKKKAAGLTASQIYNPESPDYAGKAIAGFKRPMSQWTADMISDTGGAAVATGINPADLKTLADIQTAVQSRKLTRADGIALARQRGFLADDPPPVPLAHH